MYGVMVGILKFLIFSFYTYSLALGSVFIQGQVENKLYSEIYDGKTVISTLIALITGFVGLLSSL